MSQLLLSDSAIMTPTLAFHLLPFRWRVVAASKLSDGPDQLLNGVIDA